MKTYMLFFLRSSIVVLSILAISPTGFAQDARVLNGQIQLALRSNQLNTADSLIDIGIQLSREKYQKQPILIAYFLSQKGGVLHQMRRSPEAVPFLEEAITIYENYPEDPGRLANLIMAGDVYLDLEQLADADRILNKAETTLKNAQPGKYDDNIKAGLNNALGGLSAKLNSPEKAVDYLRPAVSYYKQIGHPSYISSISNFVVVLGRLGYTEEVLTEIAAVKDFINQNHQGQHPVLWRLLLAEAQAHTVKGDHSQAEKAFKTALALAEKQFGSVSMPVSIAHTVLASFYQRVPDTYQLAAENRLQALTIAKKLGLSNDILVARSLNDLSSLYMKMEQYNKVALLLAEAQQVMKVIQRQNFGFITDQQKEQYADDGALIFSNTLSFASRISQHSSDSLIQRLSYDATLYLNGLLLDDARQIRNVVRKSGDTTLTRLYTQWLAQKEQMMQMPPNQQAISAAKTDELEKQLTQRSNAYQELRLNTRTTWQEIQQKLKPKQASVAFVRFDAYIADESDDRDSVLYAAIVIRPGYTHPRFVLLGNERQLRQLLTDSQTPTDLYASTRGPRFGTTTYGDSLYQLVWQPIDSLLRGVQRVYFSADGLLHRVAFAALPLPGTDQKTPVAQRYLSGRYDLHQLFSTRQVAQGIRPFRWQPGMSAALMGGITYERANTLSEQSTTDTAGTSATQTYLQNAIRKGNLNPFPPLDATGLEVAEIHRLLPQSELITGKNASEKWFKQLFSKPRTILHLATHGLYIPDEAGTKQTSRSDEALMRSGLALAGANGFWNPQNKSKNGEDGILTAYEVANLDLSQTRLVVLSACETALGDLRGPEGVFGLQRSFRLAGAEKLLMSLWPVDDDPTRQLMRSFYTNLKAGQEVRTAFRLAQRTIQKQFPDPTIWAAFVLVE